MHARLNQYCLYRCCVCLQERDGPKALDEFCRDLCEEVRLNKIDPVSEPAALRKVAALEPHSIAAHTSSSGSDDGGQCCRG